MTHTICAIPGDGIGQEVVPAAVAVLQAAVPGLRVKWADAGLTCLQRGVQALPERTLELVRRTEATLFGAVSSPLAPMPGYTSAILGLRRRLDLFACVRPVRSLTPDGGVDMVIVRENTEGLYGGGEESDGQRAVARRVITRAASERIARLAFTLARREGRRKVTVVHKATVLPRTCGLFREAAFEVAREFPEIACDEMLVDSAALLIATQPRAFDVVLTTNLFGDILSDVAVMHCGGLGMAASANLGETSAVFEPVHGSAPTIAGRGVANPCAAVLAGAMLLEHLGEQAAAATVRSAVATTLRGPVLTPDLGGSATTTEMTRALTEALGQDAASTEALSHHPKTISAPQPAAAQAGLASPITYQEA